MPLPSTDRLLRRMFDAAVAAADPKLCVPPHLPKAPCGRTVVVGAGKASAAMAKAVEDNWSGDLSGLVVTRDGYAVSCRRIEIVEASHPVPDARGRDCARRILELAGNLTADDLMLCLISGGGSALLTLPSPGLTLEDKQAVNRALLKSGATISEINCVRKHLSQIKGGRLAAAALPARVIALLISDVPGDDPAVIASGPTVADPTTIADAARVLAKYGIVPPPAVTAHFGHARDESPKPGDPRLANSSTIIVARPQASLEAAAAVAKAAGVRPIILGDAIEGEARDVAREHAALARRIASGSDTVRAPAVLISGGETTVTVKGNGRGGRNAEYLLGLAVALAESSADVRRISAIACDTDGIDGTEDNAGAAFGPDDLARAAALRLDGMKFLADNDAYGFFKALGTLAVTGPTFTNVNDFRAILVV